MVSCPECGGTMVFEERYDTIEYKGVKDVVPMSGIWCISCDEAIFSGQPLIDREKAWLEIKRKVDAGG